MDFHYNYILYSQKADVFYRGQTNNLQDRFRRHDSGLVNSTKNGVPWTLLWSTSKPNRSEALKLEQKLKNLSRERLIRFMLKYKDGLDSKDAEIIIRQLSNSKL